MPFKSLSSFRGKDRGKARPVCLPTKVAVTARAIDKPLSEAPAHRSGMWWLLSEPLHSPRNGNGIAHQLLSPEPRSGTHCPVLRISSFLVRTLHSSLFFINEKTEMSVSSSVFEITLLIIKVTKNSSYLVST